MGLRYLRCKVHVLDWKHPWRYTGTSKKEGVPSVFSFPAHNFQNSEAPPETQQNPTRKRPSATCGVEVLSSSLFDEGDDDVVVPSRKVIKFHNIYASSPCTETKKLQLLVKKKKKLNSSKEKYWGKRKPTTALWLHVRYR